MRRESKAEHQGRRSLKKKFPLPVKKVVTARRKEKPLLPCSKEHQVVSEPVPASAETTDTTSDGTGKKKGRTVTLTTEDMQKRKNDVKARTTLLLSLPDEHQLRFSKHKTAQELWAAILKTFGGNETTKKTKKNLLKQQYGSFKVEGLEIFEQTFNRLLAPEWLMHTIVWRNRSDLNTMSLDDLYNHLKIDEDDMEEMDIKWNMALLSMRTDKFWKKTGKKISIQGSDVAGFDKLKSYMANDEENHALVAEKEAPTEFALMANTSAKSKVFDNSLCPKDCKKNTDSLNSKITDLTDKLFNAKNMIYHYKFRLAQVESRLVEHKDREIKYCEKIKGLEYKTESSDDYIEILKKKLELIKKVKESLDGKLAGFQTASKDLDSLLESQILDKNKEGLRYNVVPPSPAQIYSSPKKDMSWTGLPEFKDDTITDYSRPAPTVESYTNDAQNRSPFVTKTEASPSTISPKSFIKFVKANDSPATSKTDKAEKDKKSLVKYAKQYRKPIQKPNVRGNQRNWNNLKSHQLGPNFEIKKNACFNGGDFNHLAYDCRKRVKQETSRSQNNTHKSFTPKPAIHKPYIPPMRLMRSNMNGKKGKAIKPSACWFWKPSQNLSNKGLNSNSVSVMFKKYTYIDTQSRLNGCSRHMTSNISYLSNYEPFDGGYVSFGEGGCKITGKGTIKTGKLEFENVYFVKDFKYNLFSVSQIYDNKNSILFTDSECIVLGQNFKLSDDDNVLLRTPRQHNMYSIDLNNIVPHKDLTCLVAKASVDECMLWHRRLGHLNFKTMNKLVRHNLVRGLPTKCFENDHTCTACLKEKQLKASCKSKLVNSISKPLHTLHMDLFGPTSVSSISHKWYCLVVTDDFSKFTWTFFLKTKDETSGILRKFITEIENLKDLKVKIIRCDSGGEFRNKEMNDFCLQKGIKREFSNARTPQQNGINSTNMSSTKDAASQEVKKYVSSLRYIALPNWVHDALLESSSSKPQDDCSTDVPESIPTACFTDSPKPSSDARLISKRVANQVETPSLDNILTLANRFEDILRVTTNSDEPNGMKADVSNMETTITAGPTPTLRIYKDHPKSQITGPVDTPIQTRLKSKEVLKNKKDERGIVIRNKARLVVQGHTQEKRIDYDEVFTPVARTKTIILFLAYASFIGFTVYQMDVKSTFLYGTIDEEVYVMQPLGFQDPKFPARVYKVEKAMYGLHQAPRAWHEKFQMSAMGELNFFLGLQVLQKEDGIFLSQDKYVGDILKKFVKRIFRYLKGHPKLGLWYPKESPFDLVEYSDSNYGGATQDRKSTTGGCQFLDRRLSMPCETLSREISSSILRLLHTAKTFDLVWIWLGGDYENVCIMGFQWDSVVNRCINFLHGSDSEQRTHEFIHVYLASASVYVWIGNAVMARLQFYDYHNMVAILEKSEHNVNFHPIVDFVEASPLRYALTVKPTVYVSHIRQFWSTARIETTEEGTKILATVDGTFRTVTESSLRRNLKLQDEEGISSLPDVKLFENLTLMGYNISLNQKFTFQKGQFSHQWKYLIHTILQCLSPKSTWFNEFSSNIATALVCLATNRTYNFSKMIFDGLVKNVNNKGEGSGTPTEPHHTPSLDAQQTLHTTHSSPTHPPVTTASIPTVTPSETTPIRQYTRRAKIDQSSALPPIADEPASPLRDVSEDEACLTESGLEADQDRATIAKTSTLPYDSAPRELKINSLKARVKLLEDREGVAAERSRDDAPIKGRNLDEGEAVAERVSDDTEEMATVLTSMETTIVLAGGAAEVPTGSRSIPTAGSPAANVPTGSDGVPTASLVFSTATVVTPYRRRKGKEIMVEFETPKKKKVARDAEVARIHAENELQIMINSLDRSNETTQQRKPWSKKQKRDYYMAVIKSNLGWKVKDFRGMTFKEIEEKFTTESMKKLKTSEEVPEEAKSPDEVLEEKGRSEPVMGLSEGISQQQNLMHAPVEWKLYDMCGVHQVTSKDKKIHACGEGLPSKEGSGNCDDLLQASSGELLVDGKRSDFEDIQDCKLSKSARNKMHKAFPLPVPLIEEVPTASEESCHCQKKREATAVKIALLV
nr:putative ribonuclease H-like domain-containing protein [Tanacetum cinerariifolium]